MGCQYKVINSLSSWIPGLWFLALLAVGVGLGGTPVEAQGPFAYVANRISANVSVIDTATNTVVGTVPVEISPLGVAITPDGTRAYVTNLASANVSVIDRATNTVVATVPVGGFPRAVAITPDGARAYVTNATSNDVSVIDTATNTVVATVAVGFTPAGVAITPDGARAYVSNFNSNNVSVIDTATNTVVATVPVGFGHFGVAITPDGARAYVTNATSNDISVIDTATNTVVATVPVGTQPVGVAITPVTTISFNAFAAKVEINAAAGKFEVKATCTLGAGSNGIAPVTESVQLKLTGGTGSFSTTIPAGSFKFKPAKFNKNGKQVRPPQFVFEGVINGVDLEATITDLGNGNFELRAEGEGANFAGLANPVTVKLAIGNDAGSTMVEAEFE